jgi:hypothetical protein
MYPLGAEHDVECTTSRSDRLSYVNFASSNHQAESIVLTITPVAL